ncbi:MAG TPA: DUF5615 family PIN-like protein [Caulobacteraceae bacterium]
MRLLVDECCPRAVTEALRAAGHDVLYVAESHASVTDAHVAALAAAEDRIIVTQDYDFSEMAVRDGAIKGGVVLIACPSLSIFERAVRVTEVVAATGEELRGNLVIVEMRRVRRRPL